MGAKLTEKVVRRFAAGQDFVESFFRKHPVLKRFAPRAVVEKTAGGTGRHPEAQQAGNEIWLFPKFWKLDAATQEFVFAHELGHYTLSEYGLSAFIKLAESAGVDVWDASSLPFGQFNMDEAFADSFATYFLGRHELNSRYPAWAKIVEAVLAGRRSVTAGFLPEKFFRERKAALRKILTEPLSSKGPGSIVYKLHDRVIPFFRKFGKDIEQFGMTEAAMISVNDRIDSAVHRITKIAEGWEKFEVELAAASHYPAKSVDEEIEWSIAISIRSHCEEAVPNLGKALGAFWKTDRRLIAALAQRVKKKATPDILTAIERASKEDFGSSSETKWRFFSEVKLEAASKRLVTKEKVEWDLYGWFDFLYDVLKANYSSEVFDGFTEFNLNGMKVVVDDRTVTPDQIKAYVKYLDQAYHLLRFKKLDKVWYGTVFIRCDACGGVNYNTGGGVGGNYPIGPDVVNVFSRPSAFIVELMVHELGHRYWFKFMSQGQRSRFEELVRVHKSPRPRNYTPLLIAEGKIKVAKAKVDDAAKALRASFDAVKAPSKRFFRDLLNDNVQDIARAGWTFSNALLDAVHSAGADSQINPEVKQLFQDVLDVGDVVRRAAADFDETISRAIHAEPEPATRPRSLDTYWRKIFERERDKWLADFEQKVDHAVATAYIFIDAAVLAYNEKETNRLAESMKKWEAEYEADTRPVVPVSNYGKSNIDEAFAEVFAHYVLEYDITRDQLESFRVVLANTLGVGSAEGERSHDLRLIQSGRRTLPRSAGAANGWEG